MKDGEGLLLPVTFNDQQYMFMLDTGCSVSVYDKVLKLGDPLGTVTADSPGGKEERSSSSRHRRPTWGKLPVLATGNYLLPAST